MPRISVNIPGENPQPYRFELERKEISIGRGPKNDIQVNCPSVSTSHAVIRRVNGGFAVEDLGSTNGTEKDGTSMQWIDLEKTTDFKVGDVDVEFQLSGDEMESLKDEEFESKEKITLPPIQDDVEEDHASDPWEEDEEVVQKKAKPAAKKRKAPATPRKEMNGGLMFLLLLIGGLGAFYFGLSKRHQEKTGGNLFDDLKNHFAPVEEVQSQKAAQPE